MSKETRTKVVLTTAIASVNFVLMNKLNFSQNTYWFCMKL
jgi:hypothetical protein